MMSVSLPTLVRHLPLALVPRLMVAHSRMVTRSPISTQVTSPSYLRSCGTAPTTAPGKTVQSQPIFT